MNNFKVFSIADYFNYYFSGILWIFDFILIWSLWRHIGVSAFVRSMQPSVSAIGPVLLTVLAVAVPYVLGTSLGPLGSIVAWLLRGLLGDPRGWLSWRGETRYRGWLRLGNVRLRDRPIVTSVRRSDRKASLAMQKVRRVFNVSEPLPGKHIDRWLYEMQTYTRETAPEAEALARRCRTLSTFSESLLVSGPAFVFLIATKQAFGYMPWLPYVAALISLCLIGFRYLQLRRYWVQHVLRSFLSAPERDGSEAGDSRRAMVRNGRRLASQDDETSEPIEVNTSDSV